MTQETATDDPGIRCPDCGGNLRADRKQRVSNTIEHFYVCLNPQCPAREAGKKPCVITVETYKRHYYRDANGTRRKKRSNLPARNQKTLPLQ